MIKYESLKHPLYLRTPSMRLGSDIVKIGEDLYIDFLIDYRNPKHRKFQQIINEIDRLNTSEIFEKSRAWYPDQKEATLCQIEYDYVPSLSLSTLYNCHSLKIRCNQSQVEIFDQDDLNVPHQLVKEQYPVTALLQCSHIYKKNGRVWADWKVLQIKAKISEKIFKECQLIDVLDDDIEVDEVDEDADNGFY